MEKTNWIVTVYDINNRVLDSWTIADRSESEAFNEAAANVFNISDYFDWELLPEGFLPKTGKQTNH